MGNLLRLLVILIGVGLVLLALRRMLTDRRRPSTRADSSRPMVQCAHCGMHVPETEALIFGKLAYCSEAHRRSGPRH